MAVLEALAILASAVQGRKKRNANTPEVKAALDLLEPHIQSAWLIPQFHHHALTNRSDNLGKKRNLVKRLRKSPNLLRRDDKGGNFYSK